MTMTQHLSTDQQVRPIKHERPDIPSYHAQQGHVAPVPPPPPGYGGMPAKSAKPPVQVESEENIESLPDFQSIKGVFGWTTVDHVNIPYILRHDQQFVSVRIVEMKLLSKYPNSYPDDLGKHAPLTSYFVTANEAKLLNEINLTHCGGEYGKKEFNTKDLIVLLNDFIAFFKLVKKTFPDGTSKTTTENQFPEMVHGWMQIKNTVTPYVKRRDGKYVPLSVMQHAAGLVKQGVTGVQISMQEKDLLNKACKNAGVNFQFSENTKLIRIDQIQADAAHSFRELPPKDPLKHAHYMELPTSNSQSGQTKGSGQKTMNSPLYSDLAQKSNPYQFQQRLPFSQVNQTGRTPLSNQTHSDSSAVNGQHLNRPPPRYPFPPGPPIFDMRFPALYNGVGRFPPYFPPGAGLPNGPPNVSLQHGFPNVNPLNSMPFVNPLAQYYMENGSKAQGTTGTNRTLPPQQSVALNHGPQNNYEGNKRSPGAQSTTPSPRSRHTSGSRPPSGSRPSSRPPSETPLSPNNPVLPHGLSAIGQFPNHPSPTNQTSQHFNFSGGQTMAQLQGLIQGIQPGIRPPTSNVSTTSGSSLTSPPMAHQTIKSAQGPMLNNNISLNEKQNTLVVDAQSLIQTDAVNSAMQTGNKQSFIPSSRPELMEQIITHPISNSVAGNVPPPLLRMPTTVAGTTSTPVPVVSTSSSSPPSQTRTVEKEQPIPQTVSAVPAVNNTTSYSDSIKGAWLNNKSISCLHLDKPNRKGRFCLVEAVCKLYFNGYSVHEFLFALENVLNVTLVICSDEEEKAFIQYYTLPVEVLKCNKMIEFDDLKKFFPQLSYMFPDKNGSDLNLTLDNAETEGDTSVLDQDNNNINKLLTNGLMSADELEASAMPMTVTQLTQGEKRQGDPPIEFPSKQAKHGKYKVKDILVPFQSIQLPD